MKNIILLALTALMVVGCNENELTGITTHANEGIKNKPIRRGMIIDIDSCQYVVCDAYGGWAFVHHNNCRFCAERRKQELKELVEQLKEK